MRNNNKINGVGAGRKKVRAAKRRPPAQVENAKLHNLRLRQMGVEIFRKTPIRVGAGRFAYGSRRFRAIGGRFIELAPQWLVVASRKLR